MVENNSKLSFKDILFGIGWLIFGLTALTFLWLIGITQGKPDSIDVIRIFGVQFVAIILIILGK